jgi:peptide deformylase
MILPVVLYGEKILRTKCREIEEITPEIRQLVQDMIETMDAKKGIGIAAPQVGKDLRLFVLRNYLPKEGGYLPKEREEEELSEPQVYINPKILSKSPETCIESEGCLSIPGIRGEVERPVSIIIEATDLNGNTFREEVQGYNARVRMHENDHINGVLFIDRLPPAIKKKIAPLLKKKIEKPKT